MNKTAYLDLHAEIKVDKSALLSWKRNWKT